MGVDEGFTGQTADPIDDVLGVTFKDQNVDKEDIDFEMEREASDKLRAIISIHQRWDVENELKSINLKSLEHRGLLIIIRMLSTTTYQVSYSFHKMEISFIEFSSPLPSITNTISAYKLLSLNSNAVELPIHALQSQVFLLLLNSKK